MSEYEAATENAAFLDLSDQAKIEIAGPDAREFLHNLCTQDAKNLPVRAGLRSVLDDEQSPHRRACQYRAL